MANDEVDRRSAILNAAVECFGTLGYYGTSLQRIATMVNLTKPGVLHYVGSKEGLLHAVLDEMYDRETEDVTAGMVRDERPLIAEMWRRTVAVNAKRPELVHMFSTLSAEALNPDIRRMIISPNARNVSWKWPRTSAGMCRKALTPSRCCVPDSR